MEKIKEYYDIVKSDSGVKAFAIRFLGVIVGIVLLMTLHELGHVLMALLLGFDVVGLKITFFPFVRDLGYSFVIISIPASATQMQLILLFISGSLHSFFWSFIFLGLFYSFKLPSLLEVCFFIFSFMMMIEIIFYIILDVFFLQYGDWYSVYLISPYIVGLWLFLSILNLALYFYGFDRTISKIDEDL